MASDQSFDVELRKAFQELQTKVINTTQQVKIAEAQISQLKKTIHHAKLTDHEISALPEDVETYQSVGRMFVLQPRNEIKENLQSKMNQAEEKIKGIEANKEYLQKSVKEQEDSIREMLQLRR